MHETGTDHDVRGAELKIGMGISIGTIGRRDNEKIQGLGGKGKQRKGIEGGKVWEKVCSRQRWRGKKRRRG